MPRKKTQPLTDEQKVMAIAAALAVGANRDDTANGLAKPLELSVLAIGIAILIGQSKPVTYPEAPLAAHDSATATSQGLEGFFRAAYILNAAKRIERGLAKGTPRDVLIRQERIYFQQHLDAVKKRRSAAVAVDRAAITYGPKLGWYAKLDSRTTAECRAAHGKNFTVGVRPAIGYPGSV